MQYILHVDVRGNDFFKKSQMEFDRQSNNHIVILRKAEKVRFDKQIIDPAILRF